MSEAPWVATSRGRTAPLRRAVWFLGPLVIAAVGYFVFFATLALSARYPLGAPPRVGPTAPLRGAYHVHSTNSVGDGRGRPEEIAAAARRAGLGFVIFTDHNVEELPRPYFEQGVLLIFGVELSTPVGHVVALGLPAGLRPDERASGAVARASAAGAVTLLAHPFQRKRPWTDWGAARAATGLEVYSADSMFRTAWGSPASRFLPALTSFLVNPAHGMIGIVEGDEAATGKLLDLSGEHPIVAVCAHDAHGLPPYELEFRVLTMQISTLSPSTLPKGSEEAAQAILARIAAGEGVCVFQAIGDGAGFELEGVPREGRTVALKELVRVNLPPRLPGEVEVKAWGAARVGPDGRTLLLTGEGAAHVEVWAKVPHLAFGTPWKPWLVPSPFRVVSETPRAENRSNLESEP